MSFSKFLSDVLKKSEVEQTDSRLSTLTDPLASLLFGAQPTYSNISVTPKTAMQVPAVASAVTLISDAVGTLPVKLYVRNGKGKEADTAHPAFTLAHDEATDWTSAAELRTQLTRDALLHDNGGFALAVRGGSGNVVELHRLDPATVELKTDETTREPFYLVREGRKNVRHEYWDILHVRHDDGAPINLARNAIALAIDLERHAAKLFSNGARPSGILSTDAKTPAGLKNIAEMWNATFGDPSNTGKPAILPEGTNYQQTGLSSVDAQFEQMRRFQTEEIARTFRVPPTMLFDLTRGTWSNTEEMGHQFLTYTLRPWLKAWEWAYARVLLTPEERRTRFFEFITDDLLTVSFAQRAASYGQYRSMGVLTANEVRAGLNLPPLLGGDELQNPYTTTSASPAQASNDNPTKTEKDAA
ncbi:head HK97 family portal protein [Devosia pacifica]|uniref:Head HK97 family portal protein n=1 Tax=Devosia pacifica TaxID=1335967 RepID=A0A918VXL9_9HYPH|nr:phage portal protein [Devosia pacifica]GHA34944.1 head HK97 family portal protein [Devosia pacifica]